MSQKVLKFKLQADEYTSGNDNLKQTNLNNDVESSDINVLESKPETAELTNVLYSGKQNNYTNHSLILPIYQTATFTFENTEELISYKQDEKDGEELTRIEYGRYGNPTVDACEKRIAAIEGGEKAVLFPSGMSAITTTLLSLLQQGDHVILGDECYRKTRTFCKNWLSKFGVEYTEVKVCDYQALENAIQPNTKLLILESPTNPYLRITDLKRVSGIAKKYNVHTFIDATFASPINQKPLEFGIDLINHSCTKYFGGHNDLFAGVVVGKKEIISQLRFARGVLGSIPDPETAWRLERSIKTLGLRVKHQNKSAQEIAEFLESHPKVDRVWYPGLKSHPEYEIAREQMKGFGGVVSFEIKGTKEDTSKFIDNLKIPRIAISLGGVESLAVQPCIISFFELTKKELDQIGIKENLVRYSVGIEESSDLIADLKNALDAI